MMSTGNDNKSRKRSYATYGKARRRPGPDYLESSKTFKEDVAGDGSSYSIPSGRDTIVATSIRAQYSRATPSPPATEDADVFDFPSSDSENDTPRPEKRKHIAKQPQTSPKRIKKEHTRTLTVAAIDASNGHPPVVSQKRNVASKPRPSKSIVMSHNGTQSNRNEISNPVGLGSLPNTASVTKHSLTSRTKPKLGAPIRGDPSATTVSKTDKEHIYSPSNGRSRSITPLHNTPVPKSSTGNLAASRTNSPSRDDAESVLTVSGQSTPTPVLTPRSVKMWNGLLGDDSKTAFHPATERTTNQRTGPKHQLPRRRLIDSFAEKPASESATNAKGAVPSLKGEISHTPLNSNDVEKPVSVAAVSAAVAAPQAPGPRITYSRQRSMLAEQDLLTCVDPSSSQSQDEAVETRRRRRGSIPTLSRLHSLDEDVEEAEKQPGGGIRTFHELRQAGANKRFVDEVEDLSERIGLPSKQPSMRRSGLLDLLGRTHDKSFLRNLISNGMDQRLFLHLGDEKDIISGFMIASILIILLNTTSSPIAISYLINEGFSDFINRLLKVDDPITSILSQRKSNMSKMAQTLLVQEHKSLLEMQIWGEVQPTRLSPRLVALSCLDIVAKQSRESSNVGEIISNEITESLFSIVEFYTKETFSEPEGPLQLLDLHLTISILELCSLGLSNSPGDSGWADHQLAVIREVSRVILRAAPSEFPSTKALVLSLTLNTTNSNSRASEILATADFIYDAFRAIISDFKLLSDMSPEEKRSASVDSLILTLGIMINLVEWSDRAHEQTRVLDDKSLGDAAHIFMMNLERASEVDSVEEANLNVTFGYLAVLLGYLALTEDTARRIRLELPGNNLQPLIVAIDEFIDHHKKVDTQSAGGIEIRNPQSTLTERLSRMLARLRIMDEHCR